MKQISVVQIGDVHFPKRKSERIGDLKDAAVSKPLQDRIAPAKLKQVVATLRRVQQDLGKVGVLICGDLTDGGLIDGYKECVEYLVENLELTSPPLCLEYWHVVPGNHDVARKTLEPNKSPFPELFEPLQQEWKDRTGKEQLTVQDLRSSEIRDAEAGISLHSLNSCFGCGEWRGVPQAIREGITTQITKVLKGASPTVSFAMIAEQLDAPVFENDHIDKICDSLQSAKPTMLPIVLAHHNLLPQTTPRLDVYTELLNSGVMRTRLLRVGRPVVYCHGHIHDGPVEVVSDPRVGDGKLILVSAPELIDGFNVLTVSFNNHDLPLGLEIKEYRLTNSGSVDVNETLRIPLGRISQLQQLLEPEIQRTIAACVATSQPISQVRDRFIENSKVSGAATKPQYETLRDWLLEAEWLGFVVLENREAEVRELRVRKVAP